jgi:2-phospho-L-lactate/phosphoenolpyruvate guanylyltransferase
VRAVLIPVKELSNAKQRLAVHFSREERIALADALWQDFFDVIVSTPSIERVFVISMEARVLERTRRLGWEAIPESEQLSESDSVDFASRWCGERGVDALLRLPVDMPLVEPRDIEEIFEQMPSASGTLLVPSRDGDGTNALLRTPPTLFRSHFGPGSFKRHLAEASRCGAEVRVLRNSRLELDVDELDDLRALSAWELRPTATRSWLHAHGFGAAQKVAGVSAASGNPS